MKRPVLPPSRLLRLLSLLVCTLFLAGSASATWSIVVINRRTGEVCVASATCLPGTALRRGVPVLVVGKGVAAAQSALDSSGQNRLRIWNHFFAGTSPEDILADLAAHDSSHQIRQYGIVTFDHPPIGFTGTGAGNGKAETYQEVGDLVFSIQGNVITGPWVVWAATNALLETEGDLSQRVMAAMEAARAMGGDGRCSCSLSAPGSCDSPPEGFGTDDKSALSAFIALGRIGDVDGVCDSTVGCTSGSYYLDLSLASPPGQRDPVLLLEMQYQNWRNSLRGVTDQQHTRVSSSSTRLVADGETSTEVLIELRDIDDNIIDHGGHALSVVQSDGGAPLATIGVVRDYGNGLYGFELVAGTQAGSGTWRIHVQDGAHSVQLYPELSIEVDAVTTLHAGLDELSGALSPDLQLVMNFGVAQSGRAWQLLGSASGTQPGTTLYGVHIPLNRDHFFDYTLLHPGRPILNGFRGTLSSTGRGEAHMNLPPSALFALVGTRLNFCCVLPDSPVSLSAVVGVDVIP